MDINYVTGQRTYFDADTNPNALAEAEALLATFRVEALALPEIAKYFVILKVIFEDNGQKWVPADLATDPAEGDYQVFDFQTGAYTPITQLAEAVQLMETRQKLFFAENRLDYPTELPSMPKESNA
jgi:hypothetical protein